MRRLVRVQFAIRRYIAAKPAKERKTDL